MTIDITRSSSSAPFLSSNSITRSSLRKEAKFGGSGHSTIVFEILNSDNCNSSCIVHRCLNLKKRIHNSILLP
uniref:Uncharacterized protein n=1 Tax=Trichogramma kaykai TaxID=54128 RepID=A0ABD2WPK3_9HYME